MKNQGAFIFPVRFITLLSVDKSGGSGIINVEWDNDLTPRGQVTEKIPVDELYSFVAKELHISEVQATQFVDDVMAFTDAGSDIYSEIRRYQRDETLQFLETKEVKRLSDSIEDYIKKAPRWNGGMTYRGVSESDEGLAKLVPGSSVKMGGTASWSKTQAVSRDFAKRNTNYERPNVVIYHCETQSKGTGIKHISVIELEDEVLCSKESKYVVERVETDEEYIHHVYVKEV